MNITLIGMPGAGKSVAGKELSKRLNYIFLDVDEIIEKRFKLKLQQIIDKFGDDEFLGLEEKTILELGKFDNCIISPGGSVIYSAEAMKFLKKHSVVVFLYASFKSTQKRLANQKTRGIVGLDKKDMETLFNERLVLYKRYADITIETPEHFDVDVVTRNIIQEFKMPYSEKEH